MEYSSLNLDLRVHRMQYSYNILSHISLLFVSAILYLMDENRVFYIILY